MEELINIFVNNGTAIACLIYFMWYNTTTMKRFTEQLATMNTNIEKLIEHKNHEQAEIIRLFIFFILPIDK